MDLDDGTRGEIEALVSEEVKRILWNWGRIAGISNVLVLLGALGYVFFLLPGHAAQEAKGQINDEISALKENIIKQSGDALISVGEVVGTTNTLKRNIELLDRDYSEANEEMSQIRKDISIIQESRGLDLANIIRVINNSPKASDIITEMGRIREDLSAVSTKIRIESRATKFILSDQCPQGWTNLGPVGIIMHNVAIPTSPFKPGRPHNAEWTWIHPNLCTQSR